MKSEPHYINLLFTFDNDYDDVSTLAPPLLFLVDVNRK